MLNYKNEKLKTPLLKIIRYFLCGMFVASSLFAKPKEKLLVLMEIGPVSTSDYVISSEMREYEAISDFALEEYSKYKKSCKVSVKQDFRIGSEEDLFKSVKALKESKNDTVIVGLSRSNFIRVAAKAANNSKIVGVSSGAASAQIRNINPNFVSIASPWTLQWEKLKAKMFANGCKEEKIIGVFDVTNPISKNFRDIFRKEIRGKELLYTATTIGSSFYQTLVKSPCVFISLNLSQAEEFLLFIDSAPLVKHVYGPGEWNTFNEELKSLLTKMKRKDLELHFPSGWISDSKFYQSSFARFVNKKVGHPPSAQGIYFYDAVWLALEQLCQNLDVRKFDSTKLKGLPLKRDYTGISSSGNYLSTMHLLNFTKEKGIYEERI